MALPELFANSPTPGTITPLTTLGAAVTDTTGTTITTAGAASSALQAVGQFRIIIDSEIMLVTAGSSGTSWTVVRGAEQSTAATHSNGASIYHYLTGIAVGNVLSEALSMIQNGIIQTADLLVGTISIATGTAALTFTPAATGTLPAYVKSTGGLLIPVGYAGGAQTITPSTPASTKYAVIGVEIDTTGAITLVKGTDTATQLNTGALIATNTPATTSGAMRIADFAIWNNAGTFNFSDHTTVASKGVNWIDRRPWARGAFWRTVRNANAAAGNDYSVTSQTTIANIDSTNLQARLECNGNPMRIALSGTVFNTVLNAYTRFYPMVDSAAVDGATSAGGQWIFRQGASAEVQASPTYVFTPAAGSHLFSWAWVNDTGSTSTLYARATLPLTMTVEEIIRQNANNGTA